MKKKATEGISKYGTGAGGSRLTTGNFDIHEQLESEIADFKKTEAVYCIQQWVFSERRCDFERDEGRRYYLF